MAGYLMALDSIESLKQCILHGIYSTNLSEPKNSKWRIHHEGTFADYFGMKEGDNIFFFINRRIYGIGELININLDCKYWNFIDAGKPLIPTYEDIKNQMILNQYDNLNNRCLCMFKPNPNFFLNGIDIDDVLSSNPNKFKILRTFWKLSFIKLDDQEVKALKDIILKRNEKLIYSKNEGVFNYNKEFQNSILHKVDKNYLMEAKYLLEYTKNNNAISHEMAIEAALIDLLYKNKETLFGSWDYISHQVAASPFKPIDYMDKMDIFGYKYIDGFNTLSKYLVIEIKKGIATEEVLHQIMKYVDWIKDEYAEGDYGMINAFIVAYDFDESILFQKKSICIRNYVRGRRPTIPSIWNSIRLIKYRYTNKSLQFYEI